MQRVFSRGTGNDERRAPWVWVRRRLTEGGLRCGSRGGRWSSESWSKGRGRCARRDGVGLGALVVLGLRRPDGGCAGGTCGDRGRTCASRTAMSSRSLRSAPSGLEENAVVDRKVRSRCRRPERNGRAQRLLGVGDVQGLSGPGEWTVGRARGRSRACRAQGGPAAAQRMVPAEGLRSRGGHGWGSMRDCGGNRKDPVRIGVESLTWAVYASALRALCVLVRGVSALRAGPDPSEPWRA